jgi:hypothetical protein
MTKGSEQLKRREFIALLGGPPPAGQVIPVPPTQSSQTILGGNAGLSDTQQQGVPMQPGLGAGTPVPRI